MPLVDDLDAIRWMQSEVRGSPVVAEVNTTRHLYGWGSRYAMFTGNPDIVGWDYHQRQQRPGDDEVVRSRVADVQRAYGTTDPTAAYRIFRRYGVSYVVVGPLERAYFPGRPGEVGAGLGDLWDVAYRGPSVEILRLPAGRTGS